MILQDRLKIWSSEGTSSWISIACSRRSRVYGNHEFNDGISPVVEPVSGSAEIWSSLEALSSISRRDLDSCSHWRHSPGCRFAWLVPFETDWTCIFRFGYGVEGRKCCGCAVGPLICQRGRISKVATLYADRYQVRTGRRTKSSLNRKVGDRGGPFFRLFSR